jgi:23S rRNA pseudouridine2457 synthase
VAPHLPLIDVLLATGRWSNHEVMRLLASGQVTIGGKALPDPTASVDAWRDAIAVAGARLPAPRPCRYLVMHKPYGVLCAFTDEENRPTLADYVAVPDVYAAGRLDYDSEGLLLLTDDGWLNHRLTDPRFEHPKTYLVQVEGVPDERALPTLRAGVTIEDRRTRPAEVDLVSEAELPVLPQRSVPVRYRANVPTTWLRITLREGAKRQIRHMTAAVGLPTLRLVRTAMGPLALDILEAGRWRELTPDEVAALRQMLDSDSHGGAPHPDRRQPRSVPWRSRRDRR